MMADKERDSFISGVGAFVIALGLFMVLGTVGTIETTDFPNWYQMMLQSAIGFGLMYGGTKLI